MILVMPNFLLHYYYIYNFKNHYWILNIQYQFTITVCEILLNTTQNKKINWSNSISLFLIGDMCMGPFSSIVVYYVQDLYIQNFGRETV